MDRKDFIGALLSRPGNNSANLMSQLNLLNPDCSLHFPSVALKFEGEKELWEDFCMEEKHIRVSTGLEKPKKDSEFTSFKKRSRKY